MQLETVTYSRGTTLALCEKKHQLRYELGIRPIREDNDAAMIGTYTHTGTEYAAKYGTIAALNRLDEIEASTPAIGGDILRLAERILKARAIVRAACARWPEPPDPSRMVEHMVEMPVDNPDTTGTSRTFVYRGKVDGVAGGQVLDWKTTSDAVQFIRQKTLGFQAELYALALMHAGVTVNESAYRIIETPSLAFQRGGEATKKYAGGRECYENACYEWIVSEPTHMVDHVIPIDSGRLDGARHWLWTVAKRIIDNRQTGRWLRNEHACYNWSRCCEFMPICELEASGNDWRSLLGTSFTVAEDVNPELRG
jgi:hypothetical protein